MKTPFTLAVVAVLVTLFCGGVSAQHANHLRYVNSFIGTAKSNVATKWGSEGGTYPGAVAPSGFIQISPETTFAKGYNYENNAIYYFSCSGHMSGFPEGSSGHFYVMPVNTDAGFEAGGYCRKFSHTNETASPGYYKVIFDDDHTIAEATTTVRAGLFRFTFAAASRPGIFIGDAMEINAVSPTVLQASNGNTVINFTEAYTNKKRVNGGWIFSFESPLKGEKVIGLKLSASPVGYASAQNNIDKEIGALSFEQIRKRTSDEWLKKLAVIDVIDENEQNKTVFYTALYHSLLIPWVIDDVNGKYKGADGEIYQKTGACQYGAFSPWDTFRSLHPLLTLLYPDKQKDVVLSMLDVYNQTGHLPTESMTGNHAVPIIVDSYLKGINGFSKELAYKAMKSNLVDSPFLQPDMDIYHKNGYIPFTRSESVTRTLEYAYDDWALSQYAKQVVHNDEDYKILLNRSYSYRNLFNADELFFLPRNKSGFKLQPGMSGYKEGDKWVYTYFVPQDAKDLINLLGGNERFAFRLDSALSHNAILFDNETVFHLPYLFNQADKPELTQKWCRQIMLERFSNSPGGLPGNDDLGSTSSWYVFSAIAVYPVCPGRPIYAIGSPLFQSVTLHLPNNKDFIINSPGSSVKNPVVQSIYINGELWPKSTISHAKLTAGGEMVFNMGHKAGKWPLNKKPVELSETKSSPKFEILSYSVTKKTVEPDELLSVKFSIINKGATGTKTVSLTVNGKRYGVKNCMVASGMIVKNSMQVRLYPVGKSILEINGMKPMSVIVKKSKKSVAHNYSVTALTATPMIRLNEKQQLNYNIQNIGGIKSVLNIPIIINDSVAFRDTLILNPGETKNLKHYFVAAKAGFQHVIIDNNKIDYKVYMGKKESLLLDLPSVGINADNLITDKSGFNNNGRIISSNAEDTKNIGDKLLFGDNCYVELNSAASLDELGETITMMTWVYPTSVEPGLTDVFTKGDINVLQVVAGKSLTFFTGGWGRGDCTVDLPSDWLQHWHHIAGVCNGKTLYVYIDGVLKGTAITNQIANLSVNNKWMLGRNEEFPSERIFHGYMNGAKIFKEALSEEDIFKVFNNEKEFVKK
ncbi:GH92 family glycosyl hydrolase [Mucilaginibacter xinganensis]|uniref:LamG-like jellyroll fold domain-containing protein n=1 Tax=Mucilaginibacter xinganensis TaxID=1234841 RepID=A0A223P2M5_9SPHI|nr:GH92 family glycosyl hydrolase [Mucilaginibacter xinganensis]ASU36367.1 hypothetical protein MuYL_4482 [Mucilaginibacter xinganensis]